MITKRHIPKGVLSDLKPAPERVFLEAGHSRPSYLHLLRHLCGLSFTALVAACALLWSNTPIQQHVPASLCLAAGMILFLPGAWLALAELPAGKSLLGGGMILLFFVVASMAFQTVPETGFWTFLIHLPGGGWFCIGLLLVFGVIAHRAASASASLFVCLLGLYYLHLIFPNLAAAGRIAHLIVFSVSLLVWAGCWLSRKQTLFFPQAALIVLYGAIAFYGGNVASPAAFSLSPVVLSLLFTYVAFNLVIMHVSLQRESALRGVALLNGLGFGIALWRLTATFQAGPSWLAPVVLLIAGLGAERATRGYAPLKTLSDFYLCQAFWSLLFLCLLYLPAGGGLVAAASLCFLPARYEVRHGGPVYQFTEYSFILSAVVMSFLAEFSAQSAALGPVSLPVFWVYLLAAAAVLLLLARTHYAWAGSADTIRPDDPVRFALQQKAGCAVCLFGSALWVMLHTILRHNDTESLPLLLSLQGFAFFGLGLIFLRSGLALAGLVPVMAGHACYYAAIQWVPSVAGVPSESRWRPIAALLIITLLLAFLCDWQMGRRVKGHPLLMERLLSMLPYLPLFLVPLSMNLLKDLPQIYLPPLFAAAGTAGVLVTRASRHHPMPGLQTLGYGMVAVSCVIFLYGLRGDAPAACAYSGYLPVLGANLLVLTVLEGIGGPRPFGIRLALCLGIAAWGALGLYQWNSGPLFSVSLTGLALLMALAGLVFNARAYYHVALLLAVFAVLWLVLSGIAQVSGEQVAGVAETAVASFQSMPG